MFAYPVGVQLFNRPEYAEQVLLSLKAQTLPIDQSLLSIFIDGFKGSIYENRGEIDKTLEVENLARAIFPEATICRFEENLGIADLHNRLQTAAFSGEHSWAAFFEEDLILDPIYLQELSDLIDVVNDTNSVVKVACFQVVNALFHLPRGYNGFYPGRGTKAFAERKSFYLEKLPMLEYFVELQKRSDLPKVVVDSRNPFPRDRARLSFLAAPKNMGTLLNFFEHDAATDAFINSQRKLHVVTKPSLARDIGFDGVHNSVQVNLQASDKEKYMAQNLELRIAQFQTTLPAIKNESDEVIRKIHESILDGYFISLSGRAMLKGVVGKILRRIPLLILPERMDR